MKIRYLLSGLVMLGVFAAACGEDVEPLPAPADVRVEVGRELGLGPVDRIIPGFSVGVWKAAVDAGVVTISERHLVGDEAGAGHRIVLDFNQDPPKVAEIALTRDDASRGASSEPAGPGTLFLQDADPAGAISGQFSADSGTSFDFWVDTADATYVDDPKPGESFQLRPGGVSDSFRFATQYVGVTEDSRCSPDVECVWEGQVTVAVRYVWESGVEEFELTGLLTPQGPVFGESPTYPATPIPFSTLELSLVGLEGDVATFVWRSTE